MCSERSACLDGLRLPARGEGQQRKQGDGETQRSSAGAQFGGVPSGSRQQTRLNEEPLRTRHFPHVTLDESDGVLVFPGCDCVSISLDDEDPLPSQLEGMRVKAITVFSRKLIDASGECLSILAV